MAQERTIALNVLAKLEHFEREMKQRLPNITDKAAARAALKMQTRFASEEARRLASIEKSSQKAAQLWSDAMTSVFAAISLSAAKRFGETLLAMQSDVASFHVELKNMSDRSGVAVETLAALDRAARASGMEFGELDSALEDISTRWIEFGIGTGEAKEAFERMGFSQADVAKGTKDFDKTVRDVIGRLQGMENAADRMHNANLAMGGSGQKLIQILGDHTLDEWIASVNTFGADVGPDAIAASVEWQAKTAALDIAFQSFKQRLSEVLGTSDLFVELGAVIVGTFSAGLVHLENFGDSASKLFALIRAGASGDLEMARAAWDRFYESTGTDQIGEITDAYTEANKKFRDMIVFLRRAAEADRKRTTTIKKTNVELEKQAQAQLALQRITTDVQSDVITREEEILAAAEKRTAEVQQLAAQNLLTEEQASEKILQIEERKNRDLRRLARDRQRQYDGILAEQTADTITAEAEIKRATEQRLLDVLAMEQDGAITQSQLHESVLAINARAQRELTELHQEESWARASAEMAAIAARHDASTKEREELEAKLIQGIELTQQYADSVLSIYDSILGRIASDAAAEVDVHKDKLSKLRERDREYSNTIRADQDSLAARAARINRNEVQDKIRTERTKLAEARKAARNAAIAQRAGALFGVGVDTVAAVMKSYAMFGMTPVGIAAAGAAGLAGAASAATILAEPLPSFFRGGGRSTAASVGMESSDGSYVASLHPNERVLNSRAAQAMGDEVVNALNEGLAPLQAMQGGGGGDVYLGAHRVGRVVSGQMRRAGSLSKAAADAGRDGRRLIYGGA